MERVLNLDFDAQHFSVRWEELSVRDEVGVRVLVQERQKWEKEERDRQENEREISRRMGEMQKRVEQGGGM